MALEQLIERRRRLGQDRCDEVWDGVLHVVPAPSGPHALVSHQLALLLDGPARAAGMIVSSEFNLGASEQQYRVPDLGIHRTPPTAVWVPTAADVVEIASPGDETLQKLPFYAAQGVDEVLVVDLADRSVTWRVLAGDQYRIADCSELLQLTAAEVAERIDWPAGGDG